MSKDNDVPCPVCGGYLWHQHDAEEIASVLTILMPVVDKEAQDQRIALLEADVARFREHSVMLNRVGWKLAEAFGLVVDGDTAIEADTMELVDRACVVAEGQRRYTQHLADQAAEGGWYVNIWRNGQPYDLAPEQAKWEALIAKSGVRQFRAVGPTIDVALMSVIHQRRAWEQA